MDTAQWAQGIGLLKKPMDEGLIPSNNNNNNNTTNNNNNNNTSQQLVERRARPQKEQALNCPRCNSTNTKFCYYNNYSLTQPRYFCKTCRRYWTEGGSLRNVPVGGGSRKNKRHSTSSSSSSSLSTTPSSSKNNLPPPPLPMSTSSLPTSTKPFEGQDLNLGFPTHSFHDQYGGFSAMELLRNTAGFTARGLGPLVQMPVPPMPQGGSVYGSGFGSQAINSKFPLDGGIGSDGGGGGEYGSMQDGGGRLLFPFGDLKPVSVKSSAGMNEQNKGQGEDPSMFWNGMMGGGGGSW